MTDNKGLIINGEQLTKLINDVISNIFVNVDTEPMSKYVLQRKLSLINDVIVSMEDRIQERVFDLNKTTGSISFFIGEHAFKYLNLTVTFLFINNTNEALNKEIIINIPKGLFHQYLSGGKAIIEPYIIGLSQNLVSETISYSVEQYRSNEDSSTVQTLTFSIDPNRAKDYDDIKVIVDTLSLNFDQIDISKYTFVKGFINSTPISDIMNIGNHNFIQDDGTIVRSNIVRNINLINKDEMDLIIENNTANPGDLSLVPIAVDESDRLLNIKIKTLNPNTQIYLSKNSNQSKSFKVNWGDNTTDSKIRHRFEVAGEYTIKIYNRIDDLYITSDNGIEILLLEIPTGYRTPTEWNEAIISHPFTGGFNNQLIKFLSPTFPGGLFIYGNKIIRINGLIQSETIRSVSEDALKGLNNATVIELGDLYKNVTSVGARSFTDLGNLRIFRSPFKDSKITSLPNTLIDPLESLEDITSFAENSKLTSIPENFGSTCYSLKVADYAFKGIATLSDQDVTGSFDTFISDKWTLRSIKGIFESTPVVINASSNTIKKLNQLANLMDISFAFKGTKFNNDDVIFTFENLENLETIESIFEDVSTFNVNGPLLNNCISITNEGILVDNCLKGTNLNFEAMDDDEIFVDTAYEGTSGLEF